MAYGQKNYADIQGINGKFKISQIGCFLTSYCNLLERFGRGIPPSTLNARYRDNGWYIDVDDGIRDDLNFGLISKFDAHIVIEQEGPRSSNMPPHRNAIVRIAAGNKWGTHFCLVDRIENGVVWIVDSWDGAVKQASTYGPIQGWATYKDNKPKPSNPSQGGNEMAASSELVTNVYRAVLLREPDSGGLAHYTGKPADHVFNTIYASPEAGAVREREAAEDRRRADLERLNGELQGKLAALEQSSGAEKQRLAEEVATLTKQLSDNQAQHQETIGQCTVELERLREEAMSKPPEIKEVVKEVPKVVWPNASELSKHYPLGELVQAVLTKLLGGKKG